MKVALATFFVGIFCENKKKRIRRFVAFKWGGRWGSNPRMPEPQSGVLTASPRPPSQARYILHYIN